MTGGVRKLTVIASSIILSLLLGEGGLRLLGRFPPAKLATGGTLSGLVQT